MKSKKERRIKGMFWHVHHDILCEWCYDYQERVNYIKKFKPKNEVKTRLRLFKKVKGRLPKEFVEAGKKYDEARKKYDEAWEKYVEAWKKYDEAKKKYDEAKKKCVEAWKKCVEAWEKCDEAGKKCDEAGKKYDEARKKYVEAKKKCVEAWEKCAYEIEELHKKECGCKEWNGKELIFEKAKEMNNKKMKGGKENERTR